MRMLGQYIRSLVLHWIFNAIALWVAAYIVPGLDFTGGWLQLLLVAALFGLVNSIVRPVLTMLTCPLVVLTLGLFMFVINAIMLLLTGWLSEQWALGFSVDGFLAAFLGGIAVGVVSLVLTLIPPKRTATRL
jgi:putative membrane protein